MTRLTPLLALFLVSGFAPAQADNKCATAQQDTIRNFIFRVIPSISDLTQNWGHVSAWSKGGGSRLTIDSNSPVFAGRQYGGGKRKEIYGTRAYGSGYPYGADNPNTVAGRPFPFGAWPISFGDYMGGSEYGGESVEIQRPGGPLAVARVGGGSNPDEVYQIIGDRDSVVFMMADLVNWCHVTPSWPTTFNPSAPDAPKPQNIIQYYRASSFALSYAYYTNTFALPSSNPQTSFSMQQSTPIPSNITNSPFLSCVINTIGDAVPIMDGYKKPLSKGAIAGIVIGSIAGFLILVCACTWLDSSDGKKGKTKAAKEAAPGTPTEADALKMEDVNKNIHTQNQESLPYKEDNQKASQEQTTATQPAQTDASSHTGVRKDEPKEVDINDLGAQPGVKEVDVKDLA